VVVQPDDTVIIRIARSEMGQGTLTGLAQLVAEELECDWAKRQHRIPHTRAEPGAQPRLGQLLHRRQPRHPRVARLRAQGRRRRRG
jgi:CO/xanthine dehydrogenase Mo-binding subunit